MSFSLTRDVTAGTPDLQMIFRREGERTLLASSFARMPFRTFSPFYNPGHGCAYVYVVNPTPGFLGGDRVRTEIGLGPGAHAFVTAPSATKVLGTGLGRAEQTTDIRVADGAILEYAPPYVIPFAGARYRQKTIVHMEATSSCLVLDWFATGRTNRGESLAFEEYDSLTALFSGDEPVVYDRFLLCPKEEDYRAPGRLESHTVSASLYLMHTRPELRKGLVESLRKILAEDAVLSGVSAIDPRALVVRVMGQTMPPVQETVLRVIGLIRRMVFGVGPQGVVDRLLKAL